MPRFGVTAALRGSPARYGTNRIAYRAVRRKRSCAFPFRHGAAHM